MRKAVRMMLAAGGLCGPLIGGTLSTTAMEPGEYKGTGEGGTLSISVRGAKVEVSIVGRGCIGEGAGTIGKVAEKRWRITLSDYGESCTLDVSRQGSARYNVKENGCLFFHGAACSFDGMVKATK